MPFYFIFLIIPVLEVMVFILVGEQIGVLPTLLLAVLTAIIGGNIIKIQGLQTFLSAHEALARGRVPTGPLFDGFCLIAAGALLITPGFITDGLGFLLLVPLLRRKIRHFLGNRVAWDAPTETKTKGTARGRIHDPEALDGEYERLDENR